MTDLPVELDEGDEVLLLGVTGSTAYGLAHAESDIDRLGVYCVPTETVLGLSFDQARATHVSLDPDLQLHELGKFVRLVLAANPTVTELLFLDTYEVRDERMEPLFAIRSDLLGERKVRAAYVGYAADQAKRLAARAEAGRSGFASDLAGRTAKHGRHCFRLMLQAEQLLRTGELTVDVSAHRDELFAVGELAATDVDAFQAVFERRRDELAAAPSVLRPEPDLEAAEHFLVEFRRANLRG